MTTAAVTTLPITSDLEIAGVRQAVREAAVAAGFSLVEQTKVVTAASELARNTLVHGGGGRLEITRLDRPHGQGIRLRFRDEGPGIADVETALSDGYTTGHGLGLGLGGARRLVQEFAIDTAPGRGTTVTVTAWPRGAWGG
ncbi:ATP-binding protein [Actinoallomurus spadix]|uniref:ATP-binding protein n=1 Tax=Actinoallomurus spadix TaxID=79912 RepID=A0ABN0VQ94_9ACTN|nr:ATP-binding protein [Actinoallomurus spadix]MCO5990780.1 ATP-binding protein [Actinoallomurus spadix]